MLTFRLPEFVSCKHPICDLMAQVGGEKCENLYGGQWAQMSVSLFFYHRKVAGREKNKWVLASMIF